MERGRAERWFENVANALLERAVPTIRGWLQARFGPGADVAGIRLDAREVHVDDTRVPLGPRALLAITRATFRVTGEAARPLVLHALEGELRVDAGGFVAPVRFESNASVAAGAFIDGALLVEHARWPRVDGRGESSLEGSLPVLVSSSTWALEKGALRSAEATIGIDARGELDAEGAKRLSHARVELTNARAGHFADAVAAITGAELGSALALLADARVAGTLVFRDGVEAELTARTARSNLRLQASAALDGALSGRVHGAVALCDLLTTAATDQAMLDGKLGGTVRAPVLAGPARVRDLDLALTTSREGVRVTFDDAPASLAQLLLDLANVRTSLAVPPNATFTGELTQRGGELGVETPSSALLAKVTLAPLSATIRGKLSLLDARASGLLPAALRPRDGVARVRAVFEQRSLHVEAESAGFTLDPAALPFRDVFARITVEGDRVLVHALRGRLDDTAHLAGDVVLGFSRQGSSGSGELRVDYPVYHALGRLSKTLGRYGVSTPDPRGVAPLTARFSFGERGVRFDDLDARVDGAAVHGSATVDWTGELRGTLDVTLHERLVRNSTLLGIPAMLSSTLALVVELGGTLAAPSARVDPLKTLGVADVANAVSSTIADLFGAAPAPHDPALDPILDRILDHDPRSEQLIAELVDRGIDPDQFESLLAKRRAQRRR